MKFLTAMATFVMILAGSQTGLSVNAFADPYVPQFVRPNSVIVVGDSLADGIYSGFYRLMKPISGVKVKKKTKINTGLVRYDRFNWAKTTRKIAASKKFDVAIVSFGANDLISFRGKGGTVHFGDKRWPELYAKRVAGIIKHLKSGGMRVYWVGLPIVRRANFRKGYALLNTIFKKTAAANGAKFVDTWSKLQVKGKFSAYGKGINGKTILLRHTDGVHFTPDGYMTYAKIVADKIMPYGWGK